ncbi:MAG TPA: AAA family ATPase [Polyangiaceae bacterium]|nr:AAA family ATPase [Polyangiaceae bacterium]
MRFLRLGFDAYGPFTGVALDLSRAQGNGLHLIYGPNEAGKSSALRGIRDLLFGMPQQTPDAHLHPASSLKLSALIERGGEQLAFGRRKKRKDSLVGPDELPLDEARLSRLLSGLDLPSFERLFALDYERLKKGGEETLNGEGDVGEALFDAGASGRSVHRVKLALVKEAEELFKDRGQNPKLNRLLAEYAEQKKRAKDSVHPPEKYEEQLQGVREKRREADARRAELSKLRVAKEHVLRLKNVLSTVVERDRKQAERTQLGALPSLRRDVGDERERLQQALLEVERDLRLLSAKRGEAQAKLGRLPEPDRAVALSPEVAQELRTGIGAARASINDLPKRQGEARTLREAIEAKLPRFGLGGDLEQVLSRSLTLAQSERLQALGRELSALAIKVENAARELPDAQAKVQALTTILKQAKDARRLEREALPPQELIERFDGELGQAEELLESLDEKAAARERERSGLLEQLALLKGRDGVPTASAVAQARSERDARLREAQELAADPKRKALDLCLPLAALAQASAYADTLADRLRSEAQRVADVDALEQRLASHDRERERAEDARRQARDALTQIELRWQKLAEQLGFPELLPREASRLLQEERLALRDLLRHEQDLSHAQAALSAAEVRAQDAKRNMASWLAAWGAAVAPLGLPPDARPEEALALVNGLNELATQRETLLDRDRRVAKIQRDIDVFAAKVREQTELFSPDLSALSPPDAAARLLERHERAVELRKERTSIGAELERLDREVTELESKHREHAARLGELCREAGVDDAAALEQLELRVARARTLDAEIAQLDRHLAEVSEGEDIAVLVDEARQSERNAVAARLLDLEDAISVAEAESRGLDLDVRELELGLRNYEGRAGADAAQELSATAAKVAELSAVWARRRLAAAVLERVVEHYRQRHQGPVLSRASELFQQLTLGEFSRLQVGLEETRLECIRGGGNQALELENLSRGTRFQLFLALKLASLEDYFKSAPPLPLVLDDILVEWDDARAKAALQVLADFSQHTQVLLFTHLASHVSAVESLSDPRICVHQLKSRTVQPIEALR